jgi:hypothetical protein
VPPPEGVEECSLVAATSDGRSASHRSWSEDCCDQSTIPQIDFGTDGCTPHRPSWITHPCSSGGSRRGIAVNGDRPNSRAIAPKGRLRCRRIHKATDLAGATTGDQHPPPLRVLVITTRPRPGSRPIGSPKRGTVGSRSGRTTR